MGLPTDRQQILFNGQPLKDKDRLKAKGVHEGDLLFLTIGAPQPKPNTGGGGYNNDAVVNPVLQTHGPMGTWDVSRITDMSYLFANIPHTHVDISTWQMAYVTNFR